MFNVLVVDDDEILRKTLSSALQHHDFQVTEAKTGLDAYNKVVQGKYDLVVMDVNMPEMDGIEALQKIKYHDPSVIVIILTAYSNVQDAVSAVKLGAYNYLQKPVAADRLINLIKRALKARSYIETMINSAPKLSLGIESEDQFVAESDIMRKVFHLIEKLAKVTTPVLIRGESGTGKELVAKAIHYNGPRKDERFVSINCGAINENLIESELFGHEKGAFTGATERKIGRFQYADGGTLFLDEIGDISPSMQVKLLRVLQEKTFSPVGSNKVIKVDVRVIAASNRNFEELIKKKEFREDLFYRLNVLPVFLPPLRNRVDDLNSLIPYFIDYFNKIHDMEVEGCSEDALKLLKSYPWPGNIRELRNTIEHAFIIETGNVINSSSLPSVVLNHSGRDSVESSEHEIEVIDPSAIRSSVIDNIPVENSYQFNFENKNDKLDFQRAKEAFEKQFIVHALQRNKGRINQSAIRANIPKKTLLRKIDKYEINPKEYY